MCAYMYATTRFFARHDQVRIALPICAPTPASFALTIKIAACPASVIVVTLLNLEKTRGHLSSFPCHSFSKSKSDLRSVRSLSHPSQI